MTVSILLYAPEHLHEYIHQTSVSCYSIQSMFQDDSILYWQRFGAVFGFSNLVQLVYLVNGVSGSLMTTCHLFATYLFLIRHYPTVATLVLEYSLAA